MKRMIGIAFIALRFVCWMCWGSTIGGEVKVKLRINLESLSRFAL